MRPLAARCPGGPRAVEAGRATERGAIVMTAVPASVPARLAGWAFAATVGIGAQLLLWPSRPDTELVLVAIRTASSPMLPSAASRLSRSCICRALEPMHCC
jgi:hypothetical protein